MLLSSNSLYFLLLLTLCLSILMGLTMGGPLVRYLTRLKAKQVVRVEGPQSHLAKSGTPVMGGLLILGCSFLSTLLFADLHSIYLWIALVSIFFFAAIGIWDDIKKILKKHNLGLSSRSKFFLTLIVALDSLFLLSLLDDPLSYTIILPFTKTLLTLSPLVWGLLSTLAILGSAHAGNLTDGLDGLSSGAFIPIFAGLMMLAIIQGDADLAVKFHLPHTPGFQSLALLCVGLIGGCIGFLWFNGNPASVFMGEIGSLALGSAIGILAVMLKQQLLLIVMAGLLVIEALSVILQVGSYKFRNKKRIFKMAPIHHHFELLGWPEQKVTLRFWIVSFLFTLVALILTFWSGR